MKLTCRLLLCLACLTPILGFGQQPPPPASPPPVASPEAQLTKFNLDFPGGTPSELVAAIQKATGKPLNAIIQSSVADFKLPALKMTGVDVGQLFGALGDATRRYFLMNNMHTGESFTFKTNGRVTDDSVWFAFRDGLGPSQEQKFCRYYLLTPFLDKGLTVDDITTAVQTGWKLMGDSPTPSISYHKETKLLIAVGDLMHLQSIDDVLRVLGATPILVVPKAPAAVEKQP